MRELTNLHQTSALHEVTLARPFDYVPVVDVPSWWMVGRRASGQPGDQVTVGEVDWRRGLRVCAFEGVPPLPTRTVTIAHGVFWHTPVPFPRTMREVDQVTSPRGATVEVLEEDYQRGVAHGAFTECLPPPSRFGRAGDPPIAGTSLELLNWVQCAGAEAISALCDDAEQAAAAADTSQARTIAGEIRALLVTAPFDVRVGLEAAGDPFADDDHQSGLVDVVERRQPTPPAVNVERAHQLLQQLLDTTTASQPAVDELLLERLRERLVTNPDVLRTLLART